jgi:hypothetical protein
MTDDRGRTTDNSWFLSRSGPEACGEAISAPCPPDRDRFGPSRLANDATVPLSSVFRPPSPGSLTASAGERM